MSLDKTGLVSVRDVTAQDTNFIMSTWLKGLRYGNEWFEAIPSNIYFAAYHKVVEGILLKSNTEIKVACLKEDPDTILGYSVYSGNTLHFVFVRNRWRNIQIAKSLVPKEITVATHLTKIGKSILSKQSKIIFNPFV